MNINEKERMLDILNGEMCNLMLSFAVASSTADTSRMKVIFGRIFMLQKKINDLETDIGIEKKETYITKFGDVVFSKEEFEYWNDIYVKIEQYNNKQKHLLEIKAVKGLKRVNNK